MNRLILIALASTLSTNGVMAQTDWSDYGCGLNPPGSLILLGGSGSLGEPLSIGVDNPLGSQPAGSLALLAIAFAPAPGFPCGVEVPGVGMVGPYGPGEFLVSGPLLLVGPLAWVAPGAPASFDLNVPNTPMLAGVELFFQGAVAGVSGNFAVTDAAALVVNACPGLGANSIAYPVGKEPTEVIVGDFDGNGTEDLVVLNLNGDDMSALLGVGDGTFAAQVEYPTGYSPCSGAAADVNDDGLLDVAVANIGSAAIDLMLGSGDGTFTGPFSFAVPADPQSLRAADIDLDGDIDLAVSHEFDDIVGIWCNDGVGAFVAHGTYSVGEEPLALAIFDLDVDGLPDIVTANNDTNDISLLIGTGGGAFASETRIAVGSRPRGVTVADINADGLPDILTANHVSDDLSVLMGTGAGGFSSVVSHVTPDSPHQIAAVDVNQDGQLDLVVAHDTDLDLASVSFGRGDGTFGQAQPLVGAGAVPHHLATGDFDQNGAVDVAFTNKQFAARTVTVLLNGCGL